MPNVSDLSLAAKIGWINENILRKDERNFPVTIVQSNITRLIKL